VAGKVEGRESEKAFLDNPATLYKWLAVHLFFPEFIRDNEVV